MSDYKSKKEHFLISFSDLIFLIKNEWQKISICIALAAVLAFFYNATRPIQFEAEGRFKEKHKADNSAPRSISSLLYGKESADNGQAAILLKSRQLAELLAIENGMQAVISENVSNPFSLLKLIKDNLLVEYANFQDLTVPIIHSHKIDLKAHHVHYVDEIPFTVALVVDSQDTFRLIDEQNELIALGTFGIPVITEKFTLTLEKVHMNPLNMKKYNLILMPLSRIAKVIQANLIVEPNIKEPSIIKISYSHADRHEVVKQINDLLKLYLNVLLKEHQEFQFIQMQYLEEVQKKLSTQLEKDLFAHAESISTDLTATGFTSSSESLQFLASNYVNFKRSWLKLDVNLQRLDSICANEIIDFEKFAFIPDCSGVQPYIKELYVLKQEADVLDLALRGDGKSVKPFQDSFQSSIADLNEISEYTYEAKKILDNLEKNEELFFSPKLLNHPQFAINKWCEIFQKSKEISNEKQKVREGFISYLSHLIHYLNVYQHNLSEQLAYQQAPQTEFQGISLATAKELYIVYSKELSKAESNLTELEFITLQLDQENFEISSLSGFLNDNISSKLLQDSAKGVTRLKDADNLSEKEKERVRYELALQREFIKLHIEQRIMLLGLSIDHLKEKIRTLQNTSLSLIHKQISILENQIRKYANSAKESMQDEQKILQSSLSEFQMDMSTFPQKWTAERIIEQKLAINRGMMEELVKLVKTKDINDNLDMIRILPVESPIVPLHPKSPKILLFTILSAIFGGVVGLMWVLCRLFNRGISVTADGLKLADQHVAGALCREYDQTLDQNPLLNSDLNTLRRLLSFMERSKKDKEIGKALLLLKARGPNYTATLAELVAKKGNKAIILDLCFNQSSVGVVSGLLQYLDGKSEKIEILHKPFYDYVSSGGISRFANELLMTEKFRNLLIHFQNTYDWVIAFSDASLQSAEAENLLNLFTNVAISVVDETMSQIEPYLSLDDDQMRKHTFMMINKAPSAR